MLNDKMRKKKVSIVKLENFLLCESVIILRKRHREIAFIQFYQKSELVKKKKEIKTYLNAKKFRVNIRVFICFSFLWTLP